MEKVISSIKMGDEIYALAVGKIEMDNVNNLNEYLSKLEDRIKKLENPKSDWVANSKGGV